MVNDPAAFSLNRPEAQAKDEYLYLWQTYLIGLEKLVCESDAKFDPRIPRMVRFMIALIAHDNIRRFAETKFDDAMRYANGRKDLTIDERNEMIIRICATMCGNITAYVDQFKGLAHQLKIGELVDMNKEYYQKSIHPELYETGCSEEDMAETVELTKTHIVFLEGGMVAPSPEEHIEHEADPEPVYTEQDTEGEGEHATDFNATH